MTKLGNTNDPGLIMVTDPVKTEITYASNKPSSILKDNATSTETQLKNEASLFRSSGLISIIALDLFPDKATRDIKPQDDADIRERIARVFEDVAEPICEHEKAGYTFHTSKRGWDKRKSAKKSQMTQTSSSAGPSSPPEKQDEGYVTNSQTSANHATITYYISCEGSLSDTLRGFLSYPRSTGQRKDGTYIQPDDNSLRRFHQISTVADTRIKSWINKVSGLDPPMRNNVVFAVVGADLESLFKSSATGGDVYTIKRSTIDNICEMINSDENSQDTSRSMRGLARRLGSARLHDLATIRSVFG